MPPVSSVTPSTRLASEMDGTGATETPATNAPAAKDASPPPSDALLVKLMNDKAKAPVRGSPESAGLDLSSCEDIVVKAKDKAMVKTGLQIRVPAGCYGRVAPRSGLARKNFIDVGAGVIDSDYRGQVGVILFNFSDTDFEIKTGDRIAQLIIERIAMSPVVLVDSIEDTERGAAGFGSTGVN